MPSERILELRKRTEAARQDQAVEPMSTPPAELMLFDGLNRTAVPCDGINPWYRDLIKNGMELARVLGSPIVPRHVYDSRMAKCGQCPHAQPGRNDKLYCLCCPCPAWIGAKLQEKNWHEEHACPADPPAFGVWPERKGI